jgi:rhodanese-related sulfurtransferase
MKQMSAQELAEWLRSGSQPQPLLLDVREPWEFEIGALPGAQSMPMGDVPARVGDLDADQPVVCICHHGMRSLRVAQFLQERGFGTVINLDGGVDAWAREVDPRFPTY